MADPLVILCPGQGAQTVGMAKAWVDASPEAARVFHQADQIIADRLGLPLSSLCFDGPAERLNQTDASQPAIFVASVASWRGWLASTGAAPSDIPLAATAGLSLGEYTALHIAGALSFRDALELVILRGRAMQDAAQQNPGAMLALIGATPDQARDLCDQARGDGVLLCANFNAPGQIVLSGDRDACQRARDLAQRLNLRATPLPVAGAFHSPLMQPAADRLKAALEQTPFATPRCPVYSNVTAQPHDPARIRQRLVEQLTSPVLWEQTCRNLLHDHPDAPIHELAPGRSLAGMFKRIDRNIKVVTHDQPDP